MAAGYQMSHDNFQYKVELENLQIQRVSLFCFWGKNLKILQLDGTLLEIIFNTLEMKHFVEVGSGTKTV